MPKIVSIDFGQKRMGIAVSDDKQIIAFPMTLIKAGKTIEESAKNVVEALQKESFPIEKIVIGLPLLLSGQEGHMAKIVKEFGELLEKISNIPVVYWDERLSSKAADTSLRELKLNRKKRAKNLDIISATLILQSYLDANKKN